MTAAAPQVDDDARRTLARLRAGELDGATRLTLRGGLSAFPREIFRLADTLEVLDLSGNALEALPEDLPRLHRLRVLFCSDNPFTTLPAVLGRCEALEMVGFKACRVAQVPPESLPARLRWLILTDNAVEQLPEAIGSCAALQKLMLAGNRLSALPGSLARCERLELLRLSANRFEAPPALLAALPRLSWLALGGNPFNAAHEARTLREAPIARIDFRALRLLRVLGEGASGVIHEALWQEGDEAAPPLSVAVKLFKGAVTSDGWPASEMAGALAAGAHPGLIPLLGRVEHHPGGTPGLVMARVDPAWRTLAAPPSLQSCTRDIYPEGLQMVPSAALRIARGVAGAMHQLHRQGLLHGDLYAHNILWDGTAGEALLGDFGAAAWTGDGPGAPALRRLEVRAFGCLLEELLAHAHAPEAQPLPGFTALAALRDRCLGEPASRPDAAGVLRALQGAEGMAAAGD